MSPPVVVFGRSAVAAVVLVVLAAHADAIRPVLRRWKWVLAFAAIEIALPWLLLTQRGEAAAVRSRRPAGGVRAARRRRGGVRAR